MTFSISSLWLISFILSSFPLYNFSANLSDSWLTQLSKCLDTGLMLYYYLSISYLIPCASGEITRDDFKRGGMRYWHLVTVSNCNLDWLLPLFQKSSACSTPHQRHHQHSSVFQESPIICLFREFLLLSQRNEATFFKNNFVIVALLSNSVSIAQDTGVTMLQNLRIKTGGL